MKHLALVFLFNSFLICTIAQQKIVDSIITKELIKEYVTALAHDSMEGRSSGTTGNIKAGIYIANIFEELGLKKVSAIGGYGDAVNRGKEFYGYNIIGVLDGTDSIKQKDIIIISAHYDHVGSSEDGTDKVYNGANDNATGTAAVLALAKYYSTIGINNYTILFIAFTGEEYGLVGSSELANNLNKKQVKLVINLEMLGRSPTKNVRPFITGTGNGKFINTLNKNILKKDSSYPKQFFKADNYSGQSLFTRSDNYSFNKIGIDAYTIMLSAPTDQFYHTKKDETKTIDFDAMLITVRAIALACEGLL
jgi:Iap family predicted aminopeptidase